MVVTRKPPRNIAKAFKLLKALSKDFMKNEREDLPPQDRKQFF